MIYFADQNNKRLADRQQPEDRSIAANAVKSIPIEPLARIQQAEKYEYENAANHYPDIGTSKESSHFVSG